MPTTPRTTHHSVGTGTKPLASQQRLPAVYRPPTTSVRVPSRYCSQLPHVIEPRTNRGAVHGEHSAGPAAYKPGPTLQPKLSSEGPPATRSHQAPTLHVTARPATRTPSAARPGESCAAQPQSRSPLFASPIPTARSSQPSIVQRALLPAHNLKQPAGRPRRAVIQRAQASNTANTAQTAPTLPQGVTLKKGGKLAILTFGQPDELVNSGTVDDYLTSVDKCRELSDQYEVWLTAESLSQHLPTKFTDPVKGRRLYYVAHGSAKNVMFDDKMAGDVADSVITELNLDKGLITDAVQIRLVGCYSRAVAEQVAVIIKKKVKFGQNGQVSVKGTEGTYFRSGPQSQMLTKDQAGEGRASPFFTQSDKTITAIFDQFSSACSALRDELHSTATQCALQKDAFLFAFLNVKTSGAAKTPLAAWKKPTFKTPSIVGLLKLIARATAAPTATGTAPQVPATTTTFQDKCTDVIRRFRASQKTALLSLMK